MSINTTSTSDRLAADSPTSSPDLELEQKYEGVSGLMSAAPYPAVIAKLANEFFAALPGAALPANAGLPSVSPSESAAIPGVPPAAAPDVPREMFSFPAAPDPRTVPGVPSPPLQSPAGALNEADFRAIAASLSGASALVAPIEAAAPPALPGSSSSSVEAHKGGPWATSPQIPPAVEMFSFPGVPAVPSSPTAPPSGSDMAAVSQSAPSATHSTSTERTDPWAKDPHFAGLNDVFSFPRVPGASVPGVPEVTASQPSVAVSEPVLSTIPAAQSVIPNVSAPESTPAIPEPASASAASSKSIEDSRPSAEQAVYSASAPRFPSISELFSFPGVPGVQSLPSAPVLPSSIPPASSVQIPGVLAPAIPRLSGNVPEAEIMPQASSHPQDVESFEFRPDLEPAELGVAKRPLDPRLIRQDFPILQERVHGRQLIWLDNAATTQKPNCGHRSPVVFLPSREFEHPPRSPHAGSASY